MRKSLIIGSGLLFVLFIYTYVALFYYQDYPFSMDEYNYVFQSKIFSQWKMAVKINSNFPHILLDEMVLKYRDNLFSKYPPFYTVLLAIGNLVNVPFLVNPLLSIFCLILVFKIISLLYSREVAAWSTIIVATNLYFIGYAASYFAQTTSLFLTLVSIYAFFKYHHTSSSRYLSILGLGMFFLVPTRPLDALILAIFLGLLALFHIPKRKDKVLILTTVFLGTLLGTLLMMTYNYIQSGNFKLVSYIVWNSEFKIEGDKNSLIGNILYIIESYFHHVKVFLIPLFKTHFIHIFSISLILLCLYSFRDKKTSLQHWGLLFFILYFSIYNFHEGSGWPQYGSRYWYPTWAGIIFMIASGLRSLGLTKKMIPALVIFIAYQMYSSAKGLEEYRNRTVYALQVKDYFDSLCPAGSIVPIAENSKNLEQNIPFLVYQQFVRNSFFNGPRLYARNMEQAQMLHKYFPQYSVCPPRD